MQPITYHRPDSVDAACELLDEHGSNAKVLAGGQSLIQMLKRRVVGAEHVVDIGAIDELDTLERTGDTITVGALRTYETLRHDPLVRDNVWLLADGLGHIGDAQIRSRGTFVGGVAHADPQGDPPVIATALDATLHVRSVSGTRTVDAAEFYRGLFDTALETGELVTAVEVPVLPADAYSTYEMFAPRKGDYAIASLALVLDRDGDDVTDATAVVGSVTDAPEHLPEVEAALEGELTADAVDEAAGVATETVDAFDDEMGSAEYKESLVGELVRRAVEPALAD